MDPNAQESQDLFFDTLVHSYVEANLRFLRREWLAQALDEKLCEPGKRFVLLTAEPGAGKSVFMAQLAHDHPEWLRYFIRRDQRSVLADVSDKSLLLRIGYQLAARRPELFSQEQLRLSVMQRIGTVSEQAEAVGAEVGKLTASPFYQKILQIEQHVHTNAGKVVGLRVEELVIETRLLSAEDLLHLALIDPARALPRIDPNRQIVILIDALDEIRYHTMPDDILSWLGNCPELPDNIRFVVTSRWPDETLGLFCAKQSARLSKLAIVADDAHVKLDIEKFVIALIGEPKLAQALQEAGRDSKTFANNAVEKADGNLGYLDALARGIDQALAFNDADTLEALLNMKQVPAHLDGLYAFFLHQIKQAVAGQHIVGKDSSQKTYSTEVWQAVYAPILGALAIAAEPVEAELLFKLADIAVDFKWIHPALNTLRQFLEVTNNRYRFYHPTVAEFLTSENTRVNTETVDLYRDAKKLHAQIANMYWLHRKNWMQADDYGLRNLARHLYQGGKFDKLSELISPEWMHARVARDGFRYSGFVADLIIAWQRPRENALQQIKADHYEFDTFATCFWYALVRSSVNSLSSNYSQALVRRALETGLWRASRAFDVAACLSNPTARAKMYAVILAAGKNKLTKAQRDEAQNAVLTAGRAIDAATLVSVIPQLSGNQQEERLALALGIEDKRARAEQLAALAPRLSGKQLEEALDAVRAIDVDYSRAAALAALAPQLSGKQLDEVLAAVREIESEVYRAKALGQITPHLSGRLKARALEEALAATRAITDESYQEDALRIMAPQLVGKQLDEALATARSMPSEFYRARLLGALVPWLSGNQLGEALAAIQAIKSEEYRAEALGKLASQLSGKLRSDVLDQAVTAARAVNDQGNRVRALTALVPQLKGKLHTAVLNETLAAVRAKDGGFGRAEALGKLALQLNGKLKADILGEALAEARAIKNEIHRASALDLLAPHLDIKRVAEALADARAIKDEADRVGALTGLAAQLSGASKTAALSEGLDVARGIRDDYYRARALTELARQLSSVSKTAALNEALFAAREIYDTTNRARALTELAAQLSGGSKSAVLNEGLNAARGIREVYYERALALTAVAEQLKGKAKAETFNEGLNAARAYRLPYSCANTLMAMSAHLTGKAKTTTLKKALDELEAAEGMENDPKWLKLWSNIDDLEKLRAEALAEIRLIRAQALTVLVAQFRGRAKTSTLNQALEIARRIENDYSRAQVLTALAAELTGEPKITILNEALTAARLIDAARDRVKALADLAAQFSGEPKITVLNEALAAAQLIEAEDDRVRALVALPVRAEHKTQVRQIRKCLIDALEKPVMQRSRAVVLQTIANKDTVRAPILGTHTVAVLARHIIEINRRWHWL